MLLYSGIVNHRIVTLNLLCRFSQTLLQSFLEISTAKDAQGDRAQTFVAASPLSGGCREAAPKQRRGNYS